MDSLEAMEGQQHALEIFGMGVSHVDVVLLAGGPRTPPSVAAVRRSLWKLPISSTHSLLDGWGDVLRRTFERKNGLTWRRGVLLKSARDLVGDSGTHSEFDVKNEVRPHRGTAGAVADEVGSWPDDGGLVLVLEAASSPVVRLDELLDRYQMHVGNELWGVIGESELGRYSGAILCDRRAFEGVPTLGFFDLKEQLLPDLVSRAATLEAVRIASRARSMRTREGWLSIAADWAAFRGAKDSSRSGSSDGARVSGFGCIIHPSSRVENATLVSSILMEDSIVEPGAVLARSIVGPGVTVKAGARLVDAIVGMGSVSAGKLHDSALVVRR